MSSDTLGEALLFDVRHALRTYSFAPPRTCEGGDDCGRARVRFVQDLDVRGWERENAWLASVSARHVGRLKRKKAANWRVAALSWAEAWRLRLFAMKAESRIVHN